MIIALEPHRGITLAAISVGEKGISSAEILFRQVAVHEYQSRLERDHRTPDSGDAVTRGELTDGPALSFPSIVYGDCTMRGPLRIPAPLVRASAPVVERKGGNRHLLGCILAEGRGHDTRADHQRYSPHGYSLVQAERHAVNCFNFSPRNLRISPAPVCPSSGRSKTPAGVNCAPRVLWTMLMSRCGSTRVAVWNLMLTRLCR